MGLLCTTISQIFTEWGKIHVDEHVDLADEKGQRRTATLV